MAGKEGDNRLLGGGAGNRGAGNEIPAVILHSREKRWEGIWHEMGVGKLGTGANGETTRGGKDECKI